MSKSNINSGPEGIGNGQKIDFPVTYTVKAIFTTELTREVQQRNLELVLEDVGVEYSDFKFRESSKGNYITINVNITLIDEK